MSDSERPDLLALEELQRLLTTLEEEMVVLRRRAQQAEARLKELEGAEGESSASGGAPDGDRHANALARENELLRARLRTARERTRTLLERVRFLRQQHETGVER